MKNLHSTSAKFIAVTATILAVASMISPRAIAQGAPTPPEVPDNPTAFVGNISLGSPRVTLQDPADASSGLYIIYPLSVNGTVTVEPNSTTSRTKGANTTETLTLLQGRINNALVVSQAADLAAINPSGFGLSWITDASGEPIENTAGSDGLYLYKPASRNSAAALVEVDADVMTFETPVWDSALPNTNSVNGYTFVYNTNTSDTVSYSEAGRSIAGASFNFGDVSASGVVDYSAVYNLNRRFVAGTNSQLYNYPTGRLSGSLGGLTVPTLTADLSFGNQTNAVGATVSTNVSVINSNAIATVGPLTFSATGLPLGLSIDSTTGLISGTITQPASSTTVPFTITASNAAGAASIILNWRVNPNVAPQFTVNPSTVFVTYGSNISTVSPVITATSNSVVTGWGFVNKPTNMPSLSIAGNATGATVSGVITNGTTNTAGATFGIVATNAFGVTTNLWTVGINPAPAL